MNWPKKNLWWGYLDHQELIQAKPYHGNVATIRRARRSPQILDVFLPFHAVDRMEAIQKLEALKVGGLT